MNLALRLVRSSLGSKYVMALTGLALIVFVLVHMSGNLLIYGGRDALNSYAAALKDHPGLLWFFRIVLLILFVIHIVLGIRLTRQNIEARPIRYAYESTLQANWASRHMLLTGLVILAFTLFHIAHFTLGVVTRAPAPSESDRSKTEDYLDMIEGRAPGAKVWVSMDKNLEPRLVKNGWEVRQNVYGMVVAGFTVWWITALYLIAMVFLGLHLWHGGSSWFQSLGIEHPRCDAFLRGIGPVLAIIVVAGNCSIPLSVLLGSVR